MNMNIEYVKDQYEYNIFWEHTYQELIIINSAISLLGTDSKK